MAEDRSRVLAALRGRASAAQITKAIDPLGAAPLAALARFVAARGLEDVERFGPFLDNLGALLEAPYTQRDCGERRGRAFQARERLVKSLQLSAEQEASLASNRLYFAAWALWMTRTSVTYLSVGAISVYARQCGLDLKSVLRVLHRHPTKSDLYTTMDLHRCEVGIEAMLQGCRALGVEARWCPSLDECQNRAIASVLASPYSAIQGGAGVGKTTTVAEILRQLEDEVHVVCVAFTHKAKRCVEVRTKALGLDVEVSTVHSFINGRDALDSLFLLVEESSMIDVELLGELAEALERRVKHLQLCFVGDTHQLPPVGRGEFFRHLVARRKNVVELTKCYRTDRADLFAGMGCVREGCMPPDSENFVVRLVETDAQVSDVVRAMVDEDPRGAQLISWKNADVTAINQWVQAALACRGLIGREQCDGLRVGDRVVYVGDNKEGLTNAMLGTVASFPQAGRATVRWDDTGATSTVVTSPKQRELQLAYCLTVHKSQGSEYDHVVVACYDVATMIKCIDRRLLYTAVSRAKKRVVLVAPASIQQFLCREMAAASATGIQF